MRSILLIAAGAVLLGCHHRQPRMSEAQIQRIRAEEPGMTDECLDKIRWGGLEAAPAETDKCFQMMPAKRWTGLWRDQLEDSTFCPAPAQECSFSSSAEPVSFELKSRPAGLEQEPRGALYAVEFIGRRTVRGGLMLGSGFKQEMIVDRLISVRQVEPPPPPPPRRKAQIVRYWKACEAAKSCVPDWDEINKMKD